MALRLPRALVLAGAAMFCRAGLAARPPVSVAMASLGEGAYKVEGRFSVGAPSRTIWSVLADYDGIKAFVPSLKLSRVQELRPDGALVEQVAVGKVLMFEKEVRVLLDVKERPMSALTFADTAHEDFEFYEGGWTIEEAEDGFVVGYRLRSKRKFAAPGFVVKSLFKQSARQLMEQVRMEILRRAALEGPDRPHEFPEGRYPPASRDP